MSEEEAVSLAKGGERAPLLILEEVSAALNPAQSDNLSRFLGMYMPSDKNNVHGFNGFLIYEFQPKGNLQVSLNKNFTNMQDIHLLFC